MKRIRTLLPLLLLLSLGIALFFSGMFDRLRPENLVAQQAGLQMLVDQHPWQASLVYMLLVTLTVATGIPGSVVVIIAGGMLFGIVEGTLVSLVGLTIGSLILFLASRAAFAPGKPGTPPPLVTRLRAGYGAYPVSYTMFLRLVPFFPFGAVTVALAWLRCSLTLFLLASSIGGGVMLVFETALGAGLAESVVAHGGVVSLDLLDQRNVILPLLGMATLALVPIVLGQLRRLSRNGKVG